MSDEDGDYFVALQDQRVFGAGIRKKGITFVPSSSNESGLPVTVADPKSSNIGSRYLSIVLPQKNEEPNGSHDSGSSDQARESNISICAVCKHPISEYDSATAMKHETSIAHQVCLEHSHPPSHLDRSHVGLRYLQGYGWDPDSRRGLGARQEGITVPIKAKEKKDTTGLREKAADDARKVKTIDRPEKKTSLNAKELRKRDLEARKRADKLRDNFYGPDLEKYLGSGS